ncbi:uncharacterized protein LOC143082940 isoform X5 [Mytilus galloprovincialis]|uniref:uncharacterized protein LOC143082940 isoform X5 n=1 Tax=Mytilus galloprovincialis TaxID=29158 RepID=UPI003F7BCBE5
MKLSIDHGIQTNYIISMYDTTGILLGFGCLFTWMSVLHYLAYDHVFGFASWTSTFQSLLSIMHGDEVYVTFTAIDSDKEIISYINVIFLVIFLAIFTLVTLNIFIAIFNTAYEHQHDNTYKKDHRSDLLKFIGRMETKAFDTDACVSCVKRCCPSMLGCMSFCDETNTIENPSN